MKKLLYILLAIVTGHAAAQNYPFVTGQVLTAAELNLALANAAITAGTINGTTIGFTIPAPGYFTTLSGSSSTTSPIIIGGTAINSTLQLRGTSGTGTADGIIFQGGLNGAYEFGRFQTTTSVTDELLIGTTANRNTSGANAVRLNATTAPYVDLLVGGTLTGTTYANAAGMNVASAAALPVNLQTNLVTQAQIVNTASATRYLTLTGSNGGNPTIGVSGGILQVSGNATVVNGSASAQLTVQGSGTNNGELYLANATTGTLGLIRADNSGSVYVINKAATISAEFVYNAAATNRLQFTGSNGGNPSIGASAGSVAISSPLLVTTAATANQVRTAQTTAPTCGTGCGTSPTIAGTDTAMIVTMGATGSPASPFTITFNGTWAAAPSCIAIAGKTGMVAGKAPILAVTGTTTVIVSTNGTAPANGDVYNIICVGVQ